MFKKILESLFLTKNNFSLYVKEEVFYFECSKDEYKNIFFKCEKDDFLIFVKIDLKNKIFQYKIGFNEKNIFYVKNYAFKSLTINTKEAKKLLYSELLKYSEITSLNKQDLSFFVPVFVNVINATNKKHTDFFDVYYEAICEGEYRIISRKLYLDRNVLKIVNEDYTRISFEGKTVKVIPSFPHAFTNHGSYICNKLARMPYDDYLFRAMKKNVNISCDGYVSTTSSYDEITKKMETLISLNLDRERASVVIKEVENNIDVLIKNGEEKISIKGDNNDYKQIVSKINDFLLDLSIIHFLNNETRAKYGIQHSESLNNDEVDTVKMMLY